MSIVEGFHAGGSWSSRWAMPAFPDRARYWNPRGRSFTMLEAGLFLALMISLPVIGKRGAPLVLGRAGVVRGASALGSAWRTAGFIKRPIHSTLALRALSRPGSRLSGPIMRTLGWRKKGNMVLLSLAAVNPLENVYYIQKRDWTRLFINYHLPFVGVPIWNSYSSGGDGPSEIPNFHRPPPTIEETGVFLSDPHIAVEIEESPRPSTSKKAGKRRKSCPPGYRWNGRRCVKKG